MPDLEDLRQSVSRGEACTCWFPRLSFYNDDVDDCWMSESFIGYVNYHASAITPEDATNELLAKYPCFRGSKWRIAHRLANYKSNLVEFIQQGLACTCWLPVTVPHGDKWFSTIKAGLQSYHSTASSIDEAEELAIKQLPCFKVNPTEADAPILP